MAVFTALRNKALSTASGFLAKKASSALGLNRAKDIRFNQPSTNPVTGNPQTTRGGEILPVSYTHLTLPTIYSV